jgi:multidrug transporter EmrE-like cation transporter
MIASALAFQETVGTHEWISVAVMVAGVFLILPLRAEFRGVVQ